MASRRHMQVCSIQIHFSSLMFLVAPEVYNFKMIHLLNWSSYYQVLNFFYDGDSKYLEVNSKRDVYSFGIIVYETLLRKRVFPLDFSWERIHSFVQSGFQVKIVDDATLKLRKSENTILFDFLYKGVFQSCFRFNAKMRPSFAELFRDFESIPESVK